MVLKVCLIEYFHINVLLHILKDPEYFHQLLSPDSALPSFFERVSDLSFNQ